MFLLFSNGSTLHWPRHHFVNGIKGSSSIRFFHKSCFRLKIWKCHEWSIPRGMIETLTKRKYPLLYLNSYLKRWYLNTWLLIQQSIKHFDQTIKLFLKKMYTFFTELLKSFLTKRLYFNKNIKHFDNSCKPKFFFSQFLGFSCAICKNVLKLLWFQCSDMIRKWDVRFVYTLISHFCAMAVVRNRFKKNRIK